MRVQRRTRFDARGAQQNDRGVDRAAIIALPAMTALRGRTRIHPRGSATVYRSRFEQISSAHSTAAASPPTAKLRREAQNPELGVRDRLAVDGALHTRLRERPGHPEGARTMRARRMQRNPATQAAICQVVNDRGDRVIDDGDENPVG